MFSQEFIQSMIDFLVVFATAQLIPLMTTVFAIGFCLRLLVHYTVKRQEWFIKEFNKRVNGYLDDDPKEHVSFYVLCKKLLEKTFYELFEVAAVMKRRKPDVIMGLSDRIFLVHQGSAFLVKDLLKQIKHLKYEKESPKLLQISKMTLQKNNCFNKVFGFLPVSSTTDILNILPGLFIIGGIFGTFLGIMKALPDLGTMDLNDIPGTKQIMDQFLLKISFAMSTSLIGILLSVLMNLANALLSPERKFVQNVDHFENSLDLLWNRCDNNTLPEHVPEFDEHRDPIEALAEAALNKQIEKGSKSELAS